MAKDPVCGMDVDEKSGTHRSEYMGKTYYLCSESCKTVFDKNPERFVNEEDSHSHHSCGCCC